MKASAALLFHGCAGAAATLLSTFVGKRSASAVYPDVMGCEQGCTVVATGWPMKFVSDYPGISVVHTADIMEVWFAADRFDAPMFLINTAFWTLVSLATHYSLRAWLAARR